MLKLVTGIIVLVAAIAAFAPATLLDAPLATFSQRRLRLADATGPWWRGHATVATTAGGVRIPVRWNVDAAALVHGRLAVRVTDDDDAPRALITFRSPGIDARDVHARVPAAMLATLHPRLQTMTPGGIITVDAPSLSSAGDAVGGILNATWTRARIVTGAAIVDVGTVTLTARLGTQPATATISNTGGDVAVAGTIVDKAGVTDVDVVLRPTATASVEAHDALSMLGAPDATGAIHVVWRVSR